MIPTISDTSVVKRAEGWLSAWVGQEHVMMSAETGTCISLSDTGGRIWELIDEPRDLSELCRTLAQEYEVEPAVVRADVIEFLERLQQEQAILLT